MRKLYPEGAVISNTAVDKSTSGRDRDLAKAIIRYAVGVGDGPMEDWQLINLVCGHLTKSTKQILVRYKGNKPALIAKIAEMGIPVVSLSMSPEERLAAIEVAKSGGDIIGHTDTRSLSKKEVLSCIDEVIDERKDTWTYEDTEPVGP